MTTKLNIANLVFQLLPAHKRQPKRLGLLGAFLSPLITLYDTFSVWREDTRVLFNVASQVTVFEGHLRKKYNSDAISIATSESGAIRVGLSSEGLVHRLTIGLVAEGTKVSIPLLGELDTTLGGVDFIVNIPYFVDASDVRADVERFRQVLVTYDIKQNTSGYRKATNSAGSALTDNLGHKLLIFKS